VTKDLPAPQRIDEAVWAIALPLPYGQPAYTLCYVLLGDDGTLHLVDPGWDTPENRASLRAAISVIGLDLDALSTVIASHYHADHLGLAEHLRETTGAAVVISDVERAVLADRARSSRHDLEAYAGTLESWGVPPERHAELDAALVAASVPVHDLEPDRELRDGEVLELPGHRLSSVITPGHTEGHLCLVDHDRAVIYTGDHVLPKVNPGLGLGRVTDRDPLTDYLDSLERLEPYDAFRVLPGHEAPFSGLRQRRAELAQHHLHRIGEVVRLTRFLGDAPIWEYASRMTWSLGWDGLHGFTLHSALYQTEQHVKLVRSGYHPFRQVARDRSL